MDEMMLLTAQIQIVEYLLHEEYESLDDELEGYLDRFYDDLVRARDGLLEQELKKRMKNSQQAWTALRQD